MFTMFSMFSNLHTLRVYFPMQLFISLFVDIAFALGGVCYSAYSYKKGKINKQRFLAQSVFYVWLAIVLLFTVLGRRFNKYDAGNTDLELCKGFRAIFTAKSAMVFTEAVVNILMFLPIGAALSPMCKRKTTPVILCFLISLFIELCQLTLRSGFFELDDILNNTLGGAIGAAAYLAGAYFYRQWRKREKT